MQTTVVGNYPKIGPGTKAPSLRRAISRYQLGQITEDELRHAEEEVTKEVLQDQSHIGIDLPTDGHIRWEDSQTYYASKIGGFEINGLIRYFDTNTYYRQPVAKSKLEWKGPIGVADYQFAASNSDKPVKAVVIGPYTLARLSQSPHYSEPDDMVMGPGPHFEQRGQSTFGGRRSRGPVRRTGYLKKQRRLSYFQRCNVCSG